MQPLWINVHVPADAKPGLYRGTVTLRLADGQAQSVPLEVRVWNFTVPKQQHLETCFLLRPDEMQKFYKLPAVPIEMYEQWIDFCVDHRISLMLCEWPNFKTDMERLVARQLDRGGSAFCLANAWFQQGPPEARREAQRRVGGPDPANSTTGPRNAAGSTGPTSTATTRSARSSSTTPGNCTGN